MIDFFGGVHSRASRARSPTPTGERRSRFCILLCIAELTPCVKLPLEMRAYPVERIYDKRAILYIRKNSIHAVAAAYISFLILFAFYPDTRRQENILRNITRARVTGAVWSARHANATRSSYVSAGFQKRRSGYVGDATPRRGRGLPEEGVGVYDNEFLGDSITRRWNSIGICRRARTELFLKTMRPPSRSSPRVAV